MADKKLKINSKLIKLGNSYAFLVPKALVDCNILEGGKRYILKPDEISASNKGT